jgi:NTP pyrophosphatase (non-canonical NTP hydrolase)
MELKELINRAKSIRDAYAKIEIKSSGKPWGVSERTQGFVADAGDLMKLMMAKGGLRKIDDVDAKLAHELSDCLWSVLVIADELVIDIEKEFGKNMDELQRKIEGE